MRKGNKKTISIVIVDDHEIAREGLRTILDRYDDIAVVGEAATMKDAIAESSRLKPDVVLMDVRLSGESGVDACRAIRECCPATRVLFLSSYEDDEAVLAAVFGGASGYLLKQINAEGLMLAIHAVAQGQSILDPAITQPALTRMQLQKEQALEPQRTSFLLLAPLVSYCPHDGLSHWQSTLGRHKEASMQTCP
ncbi:MAG: response regulator transcription factor [Nitrospira sp.]|nr:MAG: response regulator transcription factor [Nitrospira sp.]